MPTINASLQIAASASHRGFPYWLSKHGDKVAKLVEKALHQHSGAPPTVVHNVLMCVANICDFAHRIKHQPRYAWFAWHSQEMDDTLAALTKDAEKLVEFKSIAAKKGIDVTMLLMGLPTLKEVIPSAEDLADGSGHVRDVVQRWMHGAARLLGSMPHNAPYSVKAQDYEIKGEIERPLVAFHTVSDYWLNYAERSERYDWFDFFGSDVMENYGPASFETDIKKADKIVENKIMSTWSGMGVRDSDSVLFGNCFTSPLRSEGMDAALPMSGGSRMICELWV